MKFSRESLWCWLPKLRNGKPPVYAVETKPAKFDTPLAWEGNWKPPVRIEPLLDPIQQAYKSFAVDPIVSEAQHEELKWSLAQHVFEMIPAEVFDGAVKSLNGAPPRVSPEGEEIPRKDPHSAIMNLCEYLLRKSQANYKKVRRPMKIHMQAILEVSPDYLKPERRKDKRKTGDGRWACSVSKDEWRPPCLVLVDEIQFIIDSIKHSLR